MLKFIPIWLVSCLVATLFSIGEVANEKRLHELFYEGPIFYSIYIIIIGPIIEEFIFRFLPYRFIKNKVLYIIVSSIVFATMHVLEDTNPFYHIWIYMMRPLYYGYRYHKTKDLWVTISMHSFNNLIGILSLIFHF